MSTASTSTFTHSLIAGGLAGTAVDTLFFPIDTLKTRAQSQSGFFPSGGFSGVYRGLGSAVIGSAPGAAAFFTTYELLKSVLPELIPTLKGEEMAPFIHMLSASGGEVAACMIRVPTEVVKQRSQIGSLGSYDVFKQVWSNGGLKGFYRGFGSTVAREIPFTCLQFPMYEQLKLLLATKYGRSKSGLVKDLPAYEAALCGSIAGGIAAAITTPLDVCKTRIMLSGSSAKETTTATTNSTSKSIPRSYPSSLPKTLGIIYREEGLSVLFSGVVPRTIWISLGGAVFLGVYEGVKKSLSSDTSLSKERGE